MNNSRYRTKEYIVEGMDCADCALHIEQKLSKLPGIKQARVNFLSSRLWVELESNGPDESEIFRTVKDAGYGLKSFTSEQRDFIEVEETGAKENGISNRSNFAGNSGCKKC